MKRYWLTRERYRSSFFFSLLVSELDILSLKFMSNYFYARNYEFYRLKKITKCRGVDNELKGRAKNTKEPKPRGPENLKHKYIMPPNYKAS